MCPAPDRRSTKRATRFAAAARAGFGSLLLFLLLSIVAAIVLSVSAHAGDGSVAGLTTADEFSRTTPSVPPEALGEDGFHQGEPRARARLLVAPDPDDATRAWVAVLIDLDPGWHTYWRNPGDTGLPTRLDWQIDGAEVGAILWPTPEVFDEAEGLFTTYGYEGRVALQNPVYVDPAHAGPRDVAVEAQLLICKQECIPAEFSLRRSFDEALVASPDARIAHELLERTRAELPGSPESADLVVEALYSQSAVRPGDALELGIAVHGCGEDAECDATQAVQDVAFLPDADLGVLLDRGALHARPGAGFVAQYGLEADDDVEVREGVRLTGLIRWRTERGAHHAYEIDLPLPWQPAEAEITELGAHWITPETAPPASTAVTSTEPSLAALLSAVALALIGGLILNLMPCVLPVLAIKVFSVAELAERDRADVVKNGFAYTAGILASMGVLAAVVLGLRAAGTAVGWGFQFQSPIFIAAVSLVLVAFALNLFGVWEIQWTGGALADVGSESTGAKRSFFEGLLAVVLSTPCSAPFLGTAVGFAFAGPAIGVVAIFLAIGLGLAAPFLLVTLVPGAARFVPRSGAWMVELRKGLGFALLATVVWLLWIVGQSGGVDGMTQLAAMLLLFSFGLWLLGALQHAGRGRLALFAAGAVIVIAFGGLNVVAVDSQAAPEARGASPSDDPLAGEAGWRDFAPADIDAALAAGQPVFVAFSADWCITCKVNERMVLAQPEVRGELNRLGFARFKADWTQRDEGIRLELAKHGRAGVPMYLVYDPASPAAPVVLPEILSPGGVVEALRHAAAGGPTRASTEALGGPKKST